MLRLIFLMVLALSCANLHATTFTLRTGWNLLGTIAEIPTSQLLVYSNISNIVIYDSAAGVYKSTNNNQFNIVPQNSGFFVYSTSNQTINVSTVDSSVVAAKVNGDGAELASDAATWDILHIKDAGLYVEMKNDFNVGQSYLHSEATSYCSNLLVGSIGGWRITTNAELTGIGSLYTNPVYRDYFTTDLNGSYWNDTGSFRITMTGNSNTNFLDQPQKVICVLDAP